MAANGVATARTKRGQVTMHTRWLAGWAPRHSRLGRRCAFGFPDAATTSKVMHHRE